MARTASEIGSLWSSPSTSTLKMPVMLPSPELVPANAEGKMQATEDTIGPYELQDFNLYYITRFGLRPSKVAFLAWHAWRDKALGDWPALVDEHDRRSYSLAEIRKWLEVFVHRFFELSQFKRSALPNGPKVVASLRARLELLSSRAGVPLRRAG